MTGVRIRTAPPGGYPVAVGLRCYLGHGASGSAASMAPFVDGLRARGVDADGDRPAEAQGRGRRPGLPRSSCPTAPDVAVGGHSYGGRVASLAAAEPDAPYAALVLFSYPLHPPGAPERTEPGSPTGRRSAARSCCSRARPTRSPGSSCCGPPCRSRATPSSSRTRGSATRSSRSSTTPSTGPPRSCEGRRGLTGRAAARRGSRLWTSRTLAYLEVCDGLGILTVPQAPRDRQVAGHSRRRRSAAPRSCARDAVHPAATRPTLGALTAPSR